MGHSAAFGIGEKMASSPNTPKIPEVIYGAFCGGIEQATAQKFVNSLAIAMGAKVKHVHLLFQTAGGYVGDGVFLYNFFRSIPIEMTLYNVGQISSAGVTAYLGGKIRKTSKTATFMLHRCINSPQFANATKLQRVAETLVLDDKRTDEIVRNHVKLPDELLKELQFHDIYLSGEEAVQYGLADGIADFAPPAGSQVFNILG
jgi:ATP-dependent Clp protease, protease subunit